MKKLTKIACLACSVVLMASMASCSTSAFSTYNGYFEHICEILTPSKTPIVGNNATNKDPLPTPTNFNVDGNAKYSFNGVDGAVSYTVYVYDSEGTELGSGLLTPNDTNSYSGSLTDIVSFGYGKYTVSVVAYAGLTSEFKESLAAEDSYVYSGAIETPQIEYKWSENSMSIQLKNSTSYATTATPDSVVIEIKDETAGTEKTLTFNKDDIKTNSTQNFIDEETFFVSGHTYSATAYATSTNEYVTNKKTDTVTVMDGLTLTDAELESEGYEKQQGGFPDGPGGGGVTLSITSLPAFEVGAATIIVNLDAMNNAIAAKANLNAVPSEGSTYSYTIKASGPMGESISGYVELRADGTADIKVGGFGPFGDLKKSGSWTEADGAITVTY